jgi:D-tyrosyl-tRNA(Tyr) deacylase
VIALLQRVAEARVRVEGQVVGEVGVGMLALVCAERGDDEASAGRLVERMLSFRMFPEAAGKMNLSVRDVDGGVLIVPQFTLAADTRGGNRPSFTPAAEPERGRALYDHAVVQARGAYPRIATGQFGAHMRVELVNDGPVTFWLRVEPPAAAEAR